MSEEKQRMKEEQNIESKGFKELPCWVSVALTVLLIVLTIVVIY